MPEIIKSPIFNIARAVPWLRSFLSPQAQLDLTRRDLDSQTNKITALKQKALEIDKSNPRRGVQIMGKALEAEKKLKFNEMLYRLSVWNVNNPYKEPEKKPDNTKKIERAIPLSKKKVLSQKEIDNYEKRLEIARALNRPDEIEVLENLLRNIPKEETPEKKGGAEKASSQEYSEAVKKLQTVCLQAFSDPKKTTKYSFPIYGEHIPNKPDKIIGQKEFQVARLQLKGTDGEDRFVQITKRFDGTFELSLMRELINKDPEKSVPAAHETVSAFFLKEEDHSDPNTFIHDSINVRPDGAATVLTSSILRSALKELNGPIPKEPLRFLTLIEINAIIEAIGTAEVIDLKAFSQVK